jgi:hypothetical protein
VPRTREIKSGFTEAVQRYREVMFREFVTARHPKRARRRAAI